MFTNRPPTKGNLRRDHVLDIFYILSPNIIFTLNTKYFYMKNKQYIKYYIRFDSLTQFGEDMVYVMVGKCKQVHAQLNVPVTQSQQIKLLHLANAYSSYKYKLN